MTGCVDYSNTLRRYLDKELCEGELVQFQAHLKRCWMCRKELDAEEELSRLLQRSRPLYTAPESLRNRVLRAMGKPAPESVLKRNEL
jgi:mycothiol system anti-sigma-R factor